MCLCASRSMQAVGSVQQWARVQHFSTVPWSLWHLTQLFYPASSEHTHSCFGSSVDQRLERHQDHALPCVPLMLLTPASPFCGHLAFSSRSLSHPHWLCSRRPHHATTHARTVGAPNLTQPNSTTAGQQSSVEQCYIQNTLPYFHTLHVMTRTTQQPQYIMKRGNPKAPCTRHAQELNVTPPPQSAHQP